MSSFRLEEEKRKEAMNVIGNMFDATVGLLRKRKMRVLNILSPSKINNKEYRKLGTQIVLVFGRLTAEVERCRTLCHMIMTNNTEFNPEEHYGKVRFTDDEEQEFTITPVPKEQCPKDLYHTWYKWNIEMLWLRQLKEALAEGNIWADAVYDLTGQTIIKKMTDFTGDESFNVAVSPEVAAGVSHAWDQQGEEEDN